MRTIVEYKGRYAGRRFVIVGKGPTRFQYENLVETRDPIIFINDAIQFDDFGLPSVETFFFAHDPCQAAWLTPDLKATAVIPLCGAADSAGASMLSAASVEGGIQAPRLVTYTWDGWWHAHRNVRDVLRDGVRDRSRLERTGALFMLTGTIHSAIHFAWWCGAASLTFVGCDGFQRARKQAYDARIDMRSHGQPKWVFERIKRDQDWLCDALELPTEYINERHLANVMPARAHTIWLGESVPSWVEKNVAQFRDLHPDWEVNLWRRPPTDMPADLLRLMADLPQICTQKNVLAYWLLDHYGGIFFDTDVVALRSFEPLRRYDTFIARDHSGRCNCAVMGAVPGSAGAALLLARVRALAGDGNRPGGHRTMFGPKMLTELFGRADEPRHTPAVDVLPLHYFYLFCDAKEAHRWWKGGDTVKQQCFDDRADAMTDPTPPYAIHLWGVDGSSWNAPRCPRADALGYRVLAMFGKQARIDGAEVGVYVGKTAQILLRMMPALQLTMVDNWRQRPPAPTYWNGGGGEQIQIDNVAEHCLSVTKFAGLRRTLIQKESVAAAGTIEDGLLDFVFIDADHVYESVRDDLAAWWPKVRTGGLVAGHDYANPLGDGKWGVERAVREFFGKRDLLGVLDLGAEFTWFVVKP